MDESVQVCVICMDEFSSDSVIATPKTCGIHLFHRGCLLKWVRTKGGNARCPLCNQPMFFRITCVKCFRLFITCFGVRIMCRRCRNDDQ